MKNLFWVSVTLVLLAGTSCQESVDLQAEEQQIRQFTQEWYDAENRDDLDAIMPFIAEESVLQMPGMPMIEGKEAQRSLMAMLLESMVSITSGPMTIVVSESGDIAYQYGTSTAIIKGPDGEFEDPEKYLFVWKKIDGEWKVVAGTFSSDKPAM
jgi:ketosteroid isomerase-like protein